MTSRPVMHKLTNLIVKAHESPKNYVPFNKRHPITSDTQSWAGAANRKSKRPITLPKVGGV